MTLIAPTPTGTPVFFENLPSHRSFPARVVYFVRRQPVGSIGLFLVLVFGLAGIFADWLAPYNPTSNDFASMTEPPSLAHWLGTDQLGRDLLSRILFGARTAFVVGLTSALVGGFSGLVIGVGSAYFAGQIDLWMQRVLDIVMAFPLIIMALAVVSIFGTGIQNVIVAITIPLIPRCAPCSIPRCETADGGTSRLRQDRSSVFRPRNYSGMPVRRMPS